MSIEKRTTKQRGVVYDVRLRTPEGRVYTRTFRTKKEATQFEADQRSSRGRGLWVDPRRAASVTFAEWATKWRELNPSKAPTAKATDETVLAHHLLPRFGRQPIGSIHPLDVQTLVAEWTATCSAATVRRYYGILRAILNSAVDTDLIGRSPCRGVKLPEVGEAAHVIRDPADVARLARELPDEYRPMVYVAIILGLRFEEVAGLRVRSLDILRRTVTVSETVTCAKGRTHVGVPKTRAARRTLAAPGDLADLLAGHLATVGLTTSNPDAFLFQAPQGGPLAYGNFVRRVWQPARVRAGLPTVGFHDLRRTSITAMVVAGVDVKTAQTRAGHADPRMTLSVYAKATKPADRAAADALGVLFLGDARDERAMDA